MAQTTTDPGHEDPMTVLVSNRTVTLHVTVHSPPQENEKKATVLLLHGGPGVPNAYVDVVQVLTPQYQVLTFEQRGTGMSSNPSGDYSMEGYISDINAIATHFSLERFHLWGHSWGGLYAQIYAQEHPDKLLSLFLSSPSSGTNDLWEQTEKEVFAWNRKHCASDWEFLKMGWYSLLGALWKSDAAYQSLFVIVYQNYNRKYTKAFPTTITHEHVQGVRAAPVHDTRPFIVQYKPLATMEHASFPITITYGDGDIYGPSKDAVPLRYPTAKFIEIENCGHIPWWHNPSKYRSILQEFYDIAT